MKRLLVFLLLAAGTVAFRCPDRICRIRPVVTVPRVTAPPPTATPSTANVVWERSDGETVTLTFACRVREDGWYFCEAP